MAPTIFIFVINCKILCLLAKYRNNSNKNSTCNILFFLRYTFDYHDEDVYWCTADIGWITGHSYIVYGPMANGATSVLVCLTPYCCFFCLLVISC